MKVGSYLTISLFLIVILMIFLIRSAVAFRQKECRRASFFLFGATMFYVLMDGIFIACDLSSKSTATLFAAVVFFFYLAYSLLPFAWHLFVRCFVGESFNSVFKKIEYIPAILLAGVICATPFTGALFSITENGQYVRGPLYIAYSVLNLFYYLEPFVDAIVIRVRHTVSQEKYYRLSLSISFIPLFATAVNNFAIPIYQIFPFQPFCSVIVTLLAFCFMASMNSDDLQRKYNAEIQDALTRTEDANAEKTKFLSNMSHDIRTPMNAIRNLTDLAQNENDISVIKEYLDKIEIASNFLLGLINDILDMSRIESGKFQLHKENLSRAEFLKTVETVVRPLMDSRHINFHTELHPGTYIIQVDKMRFNQIFFNLLSNAAKFTPEGGDVWFEVDNLEVANDMLNIKFVVRDNGIGMSEEFLQRVFEPFAREHTNLNSGVQGTGLGLSIVKNLVDAMGGTISVKSKPGEGSEFTVKFNVKIIEKDVHSSTIPVENAEIFDEKLKKLNGMNLLLAEDNELNTYVARTILEKVGCIVTSANNGKEALELFTASEPFTFDAVLMDLRMPIMDGFETSDAIRDLNRPDAESVPIIAITADIFELKQRIDESKIDCYLSKPLNAEKLYKTLLECQTDIQ